MSSELRQLMPKHIVRGALLRSDGVAVGLVGGGAPAWDLMSMEARGRAGSDYHRLLLALDAPLDLYLVDSPPAVTQEISLLMDKQDNAKNAMESMVLGEIIEYLSELAQQSGSRSKQMIWAVTASAGIMQRSVNISGVLKSGSGNAAKTSDKASLSLAVDRARRLATALGYLSGTPQPRLLEAEEIARMVYQLCDPVRAHRYPLSGSLLDRIRRVVTTDTQDGQVASSG